MARKKSRKPKPQRRPHRQYDDAWQEPSAKRWVRHVLDEMAPKLADSVLAISLVPDDRTGDVKFWVELGASICMNKPIVAVLLGDAPVPPKLALVADEIVRCPDGIDPAASEDLTLAIGRVMERVRRGEAAA
jgi:hypothetical protein